MDVTDLIKPISKLSDALYIRSFTLNWLKKLVPVPVIVVVEAFPIAIVPKQVLFLPLLQFEVVVLNVFNVGLFEYHKLVEPSKAPISGDVVDLEIPK